MSFNNFVPLLETASKLLYQKWNIPVRIADVERLTEENRRSLVLRIHLENTPAGVPLTLILKQANLEAIPEQERETTLQRFAADWAGNYYLSQLPAGPRHSPNFYGGDPIQKIFLIEDMGDASTLVDPLLHGNASQAESALLAFATCLGQLHADTLGGLTAFEMIAQPLSAFLHPPFHQHLEVFIERVQTVCTEWGIPLLETALADMLRVTQTILAPGSFLAYIHADPCPDNMYFTDSRYRLIDFETSGFSHALADATYFRMSFPTCWCANRVPDEIIEKAESTYRAELARSCPEAEDDQTFYPALVEMCGYRVMVELGYWAKRAEEFPAGKWGIATLPPRIVTRLEMFIRISDRVGHLNGLRDLCEGALAVLEKRWGPVERLPIYPAFRA